MNNYNKKDMNYSIVLINDSNKLDNDAANYAILPSEVTEQLNATSCLISMITHCESGESRYIPKDFILTPQQKINEEY